MAWEPVVLTALGIAAIAGVLSSTDVEWATRAVIVLVITVAMAATAILMLAWGPSRATRPAPPR